MIAGLSDITFMEDKAAKLFVNSPNALSGNYEEKCDTAAAAFQSDEAGNVDVVASEAEIYGEIRSFVSLLPSNNDELGAISDCTDDLNRTTDDIAGCTTDTAIALSMIGDDNSYYEVRPGYAKEITTGFIRLNGQTIGCVANRSESYDDEGNKTWESEPHLTAKAAVKAADFVNLCDSFDIPVLTLTNVNGFEADMCNEKSMVRAASKLSFAFADATVPKVNVIIGKAFGSAGIIMNSKALGCDMTIAWDSAKIGMMESDLAAKVIYDGKSEEEIKNGAKQFDKLQNSIESAARRGYVDQVIAASQTRKYVISAFEMLYTKREDRPARKHGTV